MAENRLREEMFVREALDSELSSVLSVERAAFGSDEEAVLVRGLLEDPTAEPTLSLLAFAQQRPVGHILFSKARLDPQAPLSVSILAPLAVVPDAQRQGIGGALIKHGLRVLSERGVDAVFVLGHPEYYPRHGFLPAGDLGFDTPFPIASENANAWMVLALNERSIRAFHGRVVCANKLSRPEYWCE